MARRAPEFVCQNCGATFGRWQGKCEACGEWNTIVEETAAATPGPLALYGWPRFSPDGKSIAVTVADPPAQIVAGFTLTVGNALTVRVAGLEVTGEPHAPLTTTSYDPASPVPTAVFV